MDILKQGRHPAGPILSMKEVCTRTNRCGQRQPWSSEYPSVAVSFSVGNPIKCPTVRQKVTRSPCWANIPRNPAPGSRLHRASGGGESTISGAARPAGGRSPPVIVPDIALKAAVEYPAAFCYLKTRNCPVILHLQKTNIAMSKQRHCCGHLGIQIVAQIMMRRLRAARRILPCPSGFHRPRAPATLSAAYGTIAAVDLKKTKVDPHACVGDLPYFGFEPVQSTFVRSLLSLSQTV